MAQTPVGVGLQGRVCHRRAFLMLLPEQRSVWLAGGPGRRSRLRSRPRRWQALQALSVTQPPSSPFNVP